MSKTVTIPSTAKPWTCEVNGIKYTYEAGSTQTVPDEVAVIIESQDDFPPAAPAPSAPFSGGGGGFKVTFSFNDDDFTITADKTYAEVKAAVEAGEFVYGTASVPGLGVGSVVCGGILDDGVAHFVSIGMTSTEDGEQRIDMIWFNYNPDGTFDFNMEHPPYEDPLPYVWEGDNGKIMKVVDGKWEAAEA